MSTLSATTRTGQQATGISRGQVRAMAAVGVLARVHRSRTRARGTR